MSESISELAAAKYALLTTYRRDGRPVGTPVWTAVVDGGVGVWTAADSGKVKRIRRNPSVTLASCDIRGRIKGPTYEGSAELLDADATRALERQIISKYGWQARLTLLGSRLRRRRSGTIGIRIQL